MKNAPIRGATEAQPVRIEFHHEQAQTVSIAGSFNHWRAMPLLRIADGRWIRVIFLTPGAYQYQFVVDGPPAGDAPPVLTEVCRGSSTSSTPLHTMRVRSAAKRRGSKPRLSRVRMESLERSLPRQIPFVRSQE